MGLFDWLFGEKIAISEQKITIKAETNNIETLVKIVRNEMSEEIHNVEFGTTDLSREVLENVKREVSITLSKGANWTNCKSTKLLPNYFKWQEYDEWVAKIAKLRNKPDLFDYYSKPALYQSTLHTQAVEQAKLKDWKECGVKKVKFICNSDSCTLCKKIKKIFTIDEAPMVGKDRHPGCRCTFVAMD